MVASVFLAINNENPRPVHQKPGRKSRPEVQTGSDFFEFNKAQQMMETLNDLANGEELDGNHECNYQDDVNNQMQNEYYDINR